LYRSYILGAPLDNWRRAMGAVAHAAYSQSYEEQEHNQIQEDDFEVGLYKLNAVG
jgi:hypothetical protein